MVHCSVLRSVFAAFPLLTGDWHVLPNQIINDHPAFQLSAEQETGFKSLFLYYVPTSWDSLGRWCIGDTLSAPAESLFLAFIDSYAPSPPLIQPRDYASSPHWGVAVDGDWADIEASFQCIDDTGTDAKDDVGFHIAVDPVPLISGFFVHTGYENVFINPRGPFYLRPHTQVPDAHTRWVISESLNSSNAFAFADVPNRNDYDVISSFKNVDWHAPLDGDWKPVTSRIITIASGKEEPRSLWRNWLSMSGATSVGSGEKTDKYTTLWNGVKAPLLSFGTGGLDPQQTTESLQIAFEEGLYEGVDTASAYLNEQEVGDAMRKFHPAGREGVFITSKVWPTSLGFGATMAALDGSLLKLGVSEVDLYLLHWPFCYSHFDWMDCTQVSDPNGTWRQSLRALQKAHAEGRVRAFGVSNFDSKTMEEALDIVTPHVVQNWLDPSHADTEVLLQCKQYHILYQAYATLRGVMQTLADLDSSKQEASSLTPYGLAQVRRVAEHLHRPAAQVYLKWLLQQGISVLPRSHDASHIRENAQLFDWTLPVEVVEYLNAVSQSGTSDVKLNLDFLTLDAQVGAKHKETSASFAHQF